MKERNLSLDVLRTIACLMVVMMHSPNPQSGLSSIECVGINMFTEPCIELFFMVSGALLLPVRMSYFDFLKRRLGRVLMPTLFFTLFYIIVSMCYGEKSVVSMINAICSIPFSAQGHGILWFMYTLIGVYLVAPILTPFLERATKRELQFVLLLWMVTTCWPLLSLFLQVNTGDTSMLHIFSGYTGYFVLGYYLTRFPHTFSPVVLFCMLFVPFVSYGLIKHFGYEVDFSSLFWYLSIFCVVMCVAWWQFVMQYIRVRIIGEKWQNLLVNFSNCSFGIYLIHIFIMCRGIWQVIPLSITPPHYTVFNHVYNYSTHFMGHCRSDIKNQSGRVLDRLYK